MSWTIEPASDKQVRRTDDGRLALPLRTCGIGRIPPPWRAQVRPGDVIVANVGCGIVRLTVTADHGAHGGFLPTLAAFMTARPDTDTAAPPAKSYAAKLMTSVGLSRDFVLPLNLAEDMPKFLGSLAQPDIAQLTLINADGREVHGLMHAPSDSWARITPRSDGTVLVETGGPRDLWAERAPLLEHWAEAGRPAAESYGLTVHPDGRHELWHGSPEARTWHLSH